MFDDGQFPITVGTILVKRALPAQASYGVESRC